MKLLDKKIDKKKSIGDVAEELGVQTHVIRFWESKFPQIKPIIGKGSRRYYLEKDVDVLKKIKSFLYEEGYTITGLQNLLRKRKKNDNKEQDLQFLLTQPIITNLGKDDTNRQLENIISIIESKLDRFEKLLSEH